MNRLPFRRRAEKIAPVRPRHEELLRRALRQQSESIHVRDGLQRIRARTRKPAGAKPFLVRRWAPALGGLAAACALAVSALTTLGDPPAATPSAALPSLETTGPTAALPGGSPAPTGPSAPAPTAGAATSGPTRTPAAPNVADLGENFREGFDRLAQELLPGLTSSPKPAPSTTAPTATAPYTVALYYIGTGFTGDSLYREFATATSSSDRATGALHELMSRPAADPDYATAFPSELRFGGYTRDARTGVVQLRGPGQLGSLGIQQIVYTVTAADPLVDNVRVFVNGEALSPEPVGRDATRIAPIWLLDLEEGDYVPDEFPLEGEAQEQVASVSWEALADGQPVANGSAPVSSTGSRRSWSADISLPGPGTYVVRATSPDLPDGVNETKTVRVR